jgi:PEP-CTERM motif-containing protein
VLLTVSTVYTPTLATAMPVLHIDASGQLLGASNVDVLGNLYNVSFLDGTYYDIFGQTIPPKHAFSESTAIAASNALLSTVFLDISPTLLFDSRPDHTNGIDNAIAGVIFTPFYSSPFPLHVSMAAVENNWWNDDDDVFTAGFSLSGDTARSGGLAYAKWTPVPEPSTFILLGSGLIGLISYRRKRRAS